MHHPGALGAEGFEHLGQRREPRLGEHATIWRLTPAGLESGPSRLKMVRVPSSTRVGPTFFMAGWCVGANMKPMPVSAMQREMAAGARSMRTPNAASTSAAPDLEESARLPCLATGTPAPATMKEAQVEML